MEVIAHKEKKNGGSRQG